MNLHQLFMLMISQNMLLERAVRFGRLGAKLAHMLVRARKVLRLDVRDHVGVVPQLLVAQRTREQGPLVLAGDGGDYVLAYLFQRF